ncbi:hypothetical protein HQ43_03810 [Porphyromonas canoris]|uniref:Uncharacterized protein n=1 Tax=Porphyromonas canoris TaxID=36875 RepID=A0ABR4XNV2_9PORP|nr:hypothetical protein HQ43_03810 [Porphyromonas canoris]
MIQKRSEQRSERFFCFRIPDFEELFHAPDVSFVPFPNVSAKLFLLLPENGKTVAGDVCRDSTLLEQECRSE